MRQLFQLALVFLLACALSARAHADDITTFRLTSDLFNYSPGPNGPYTLPGPSGNIVIDTTTGIILGGEISVQALPYYSYQNVPVSAFGQGIFETGEQLVVESVLLVDANDTIQLSLNFPLLEYDTIPYPYGPTLAGYTGGPVCAQISYLCYIADNASYVDVYYPSESGTGGAEQIFQDGELTPETTITSTPEPSTLLMLTTGLSGIAGLLRKQHSARNPRLTD